MNRTKQLGWQFGAALAVAALVGTSAFAESRHSDETRSRVHRGERRTEARAQAPSGEQSQRWTRGDDAQRSGATRRDDSSGSRNRDNGDSRSWDRSRSDADRNYDNRSYDRNRDSNRNDNRNDRRYDNNRNDNRYDHRYDNRNDRRYDSRNDRRYDNRYDNRGYRNDYRGSYDRHRPYYAYGRVSRLERYGGGYRVWVGGSIYPFFVPEVRFRLFPLRVGINIRIGGYYNPLGYYDYYDVGPYSSSPIYTSGDLRGVVESVDFRRGTAVVRDDISGSFVTVLLTRGDRLVDDLRPGDYVDLTGAWTRSGLFEAYRVASLDQDGYRR